MFSQLAERQRRLIVLGGLVPVALVCSLLCLPSARAAIGEYEVGLCTAQGSAFGQGVEVHEAGDRPDREPINLETGPCVPGQGGIPSIVSTVGEGLAVGFSEWIVSAPQGTLISKVTGERAVVVQGTKLSQQIIWDVGPADPTIHLERTSAANPPPSGPFTWTPLAPGTQSLHAGVLCQIAKGCDNEEREMQVLLTNVVATVTDQQAPTVTMAGPLLSGGPIRGTRDASVNAADKGGGVAKVTWIVDGQAREAKGDPNSGLCAKPFKAMKPCKGELAPTFSLDSSALTEGTHRVEALVEDASGQTASAGAEIVVHNRPLSTAPPALSGSAKVKASLHASAGKWDGNPASFAYQWLRCPGVAEFGDDVFCEKLAGAVQQDYEAAAADVGKRLAVKVTATNGTGSEAAFSAPSAIVAGAGVGQGELPPGSGKRPPQTKITKHPRRKSAIRKVKFAFSADQAGSSFQCKLDKGRFKPCRSPFRHKTKPGRHRFQVRAINAAGLADASPAVFGWTVF